MSLGYFIMMCVFRGTVAHRKAAPVPHVLLRLAEGEHDRAAGRKPDDHLPAQGGEGADVDTLVLEEADQHSLLPALRDVLLGGLPDLPGASVRAGGLDLRVVRV